MRCILHPLSKAEGKPLICYPSQQLYSRRKEETLMSNEIFCWKGSSQNQGNSAEQTFRICMNRFYLEKAEKPSRHTPVKVFLGAAQNLLILLSSLHNQNKPKVTPTCHPFHLLEPVQRKQQNQCLMLLKQSKLIHSSSFHLVGINICQNEHPL